MLDYATQKQNENCGGINMNLKKPILFEQENLLRPPIKIKSTHLFRLRLIETQ